ncbi:hypothetical protein LINPERPRIM_LOCUS23833 [Linum perenne]
MEWKASERTNYSSRYDSISYLLDIREGRKIQVFDINNVAIDVLGKQGNLKELHGIDPKIIKVRNQNLPCQH